MDLCVKCRCVLLMDLDVTGEVKLTLDVSVTHGCRCNMWIYVQHVQSLCNKWICMWHTHLCVASGSACNIDLCVTWRSKRNMEFQYLHS